MSPTAATKAASNKPVRRAAAAKDEAVDTTPAAPATETDNQKRNRLRNEAERYILNKHKDEFDDYAEKLFSDNGLKFNRRLSEAQKAEKKIEDLIQQHPELEEMLRAKFAADHPEAVTTQDANPEADAPNYEADVEALPEPVQYTEPVAAQEAAITYGEDGPDYAAENDPFHPGYAQQ